MKRRVTSLVGLLVGAGSVGKRHASVLANRYQKVIVIDSNPAALMWASHELPCETVCASSLEEVRPSIQASADDITAVIATWGPSHFQTFEQLVTMGVSRVFCEKPLATSLQQIRSMRRLCSDTDVALTAGLHLRYRGIVEFINSVSRESLGGKPTSFVVDGGARCIATNGTHWLDLAIGVFGSPPRSVVADLNSAPVNPRSSELLYWGGAASWEFSNGERLTINYDNRSSVHERVRIYAANGVVEIDSSFTVRAFRRNQDEIAADKRVARTGDVTPTSVGEHSTQFNEVLSQQLDEIENLTSPRYTAEAAFTTAEALLLAFEASKSGRRLACPATDEVINACTDWNIS